MAVFFLSSTSAQASDWAQESGYCDKTKGKFVYGVKNTLLGWTALFTEPYKAKYQTPPGKPWQGFCVGAARAVVYTASGMIQLVSFPVPVDFPNVGKGVGYPEQPKSYLSAESTEEIAPAPVPN